MEFFHGATLEDIIDSDVHLVLSVPEGADDDGDVISAPLCQTFMKDGELWVDCDPERSRTNVAPVPLSARVTRQDKDLAIGRFCIMVDPSTELGLLIQRNFEAQQRADLKRRKGRNGH